MILKIMIKPPILGLFKLLFVGLW